MAVLPAQERRRFLKPKPSFNGRTSKHVVPWEQSIYRCWYEYLRRSQRYADACRQNGKNMTVVYEDFGDVFTGTFESWWTERLSNGLQRGMYLFAETALPVPRLPATVEDIRQYEEQIASGDVICILLPGGQTFTDTLRLGKRILANHHDIKGRTTESTARYKLAKVTKNSVRSLLDGLRALDLREKAFKYWQIGAILKEESRRRAKYEHESSTAKDRANSLSTVYDETKFSVADFGNEATGQILVRTREEPYPPYYKVCHSHGERVVRRALKNVKAAEEAQPSEGHIGWGTFPITL